MSHRKRFKDLSKSQKNRRLKKAVLLLENPSSSSEYNQGADDVKSKKNKNIDNMGLNNYCDDFVTLNISDGDLVTVNDCEGFISDDNENSDDQGVEIASELYDTSKNDTTFNTKEDIAQWVCQFNIAHLALGRLLKIKGEGDKYD